MLEQKNKGRARMRLAVFCVLSIHVIGLMALLMQGCRKPPEETPAGGTTNTVPSPEATSPAVTETNPSTTAVAPTAVEPTAPTPAPGAAQEYVVAKGDSFFTIAKKFSVSTKAVEDANPGVQPTKLKIGQKLQIPAPASASTTTPSPGAPAASDAGMGGQESYTVKSGDTLTKIASQFGTTIKALRSENNLTTDKIKVGQKLKIPAKASPPAPVPAVPSASAATNPTA
jgi:LysM repeat protein